MKDNTKYACTYFDHNFLHRGNALIESYLKNSGEDDVIFVLALDEETKFALAEINNDRIKIIGLHDIFCDTERVDIYQTSKEFFFSLTPTLCKYLLLNNELSHILYLDADLYIFSSLECLYYEVQDYNIAACSHRRPFLIDLFGKNYGRFNVGINYFSNCDESIQCLIDWEKQCRDWHPGLENYKLNFFSDQIWLDEWPSKYKGFYEIENIGINLAPWNQSRYKFSYQDGSFYVNQNKVVAFHFSNLIQIEKGVWIVNMNKIPIRIDGVLKKIYNKYLNKLKNEKIFEQIKFSKQSSFFSKIIDKILKLFNKNKIYVE